MGASCGSERPANAVIATKMSVRAATPTQAMDLELTMDGRDTLDGRDVGRAHGGTTSTQRVRHVAPRHVWTRAVITIAVEPATAGVVPRWCSATYRPVPPRHVRACAAAEPGRERAHRKTRLPRRPLAVGVAGPLPGVELLHEVAGQRRSCRQCRAGACCPGAASRGVRSAAGQRVRRAGERLGTRAASWAARMATSSSPRSSAPCARPEVLPTSV